MEFLGRVEIEEKFKESDIFPEGRFLEGYHTYFKV